MLSKRYLKRLISARAAQLTSTAFPDLEAVEHYAEQSVSSVYYLLLEASGEDIIICERLWFIFLKAK
jgi:NADH dehydrogenase [ubiquinone] 1 alpha subcomplex assembly factor 6